MKKNFVIQFLCLLFAITGCAGKKYFSAPEKTRSNFSMVWSKALDPEYDAGNLPISFGGPTVHQGIVYMGNQSGRMEAYDIADGRELWRVDEKQVLGAAGLIYKDQIIYGSYEGRVFSRHYLTGKLKYELDVGGSVESAPVAHQERLFIHLRNHQLVCLDAETGKIFWSYKRSVAFSTTIQSVSRPLGIDNKIIVGFADGYVAALGIEDGSVLWEKQLAQGSKFVDVDARPVLFGDKVYIGPVAGSFYALRAETGQIERTFDFTIARPPVILKAEQKFFKNAVNNEILLAGTVEGELVQIMASGEVGKKIKLSKYGISSIVPWKGFLAVATLDGRVHLMTTDELKKVDEFFTGSPFSSVFSPLLVEDETLIVFSSRNRLYVFR